MILAELEDEQRWDKAFARSPDILAKLATEAMAEYRAGETSEQEGVSLNQYIVSLLSAISR